MQTFGNWVNSVAEADGRLLEVPSLNVVCPVGVRIFMDSVWDKVQYPSFTHEIYCSKSSGVKIKT